MCGRKRDPKVDEQLKENKAEAEAAKETAQADLADAKAKSLETAIDMAPSDQTVTEGQLDRQSENIFDDPKMKSMAALRRSRRAGGRGRRAPLQMRSARAPPSSRRGASGRPASRESRKACHSSAIRPSRPMIVAATAARACI